MIQDYINMTHPIQIELFAELSIGTVSECIQPPTGRGRVKFRASQWPARYYYGDCPLTVKEGDKVVVLGMEGITLLVLPEGYLTETQLQNLRSPRHSWTDLRSA